MEIVYKRKSVSAMDIWGEIPDIPSYSAVRSVLSILEDKGLLKHRRQGKKYIYSPLIFSRKASVSAAKQLLTTYFDNSLEKAVTAILEMHSTNLTKENYKRLYRIIDRARKEVSE
jgi:predicted transcriptional regulator